MPDRVSRSKKHPRGAVLWSTETGAALTPPPDPRIARNCDAVRHSSVDSIIAYPSTSQSPTPLLIIKACTGGGGGGVSPSRVPPPHMQHASRAEKSQSSNCPSHRARILSSRVVPSWPAIVQISPPTSVAAPAWSAH